MSRNLLDSCPFRSVKSPVAGDHFVFIFDAVHRAYDQRREDAELPDAVFECIHFGVILHMERVPFKRMKGANGNDDRFVFHFVFLLA